MLYVLMTSALSFLKEGTFSSHDSSQTHASTKPILANTATSTSGRSSILGHKVFDDKLAQLALLQLAIAVLAFTSFHVQIVNRISSGYPLWYIWLASRIVQVSSSMKEGARDEAQSRQYWQDQIMLRSMIVYAAIHAGLFASFLPPA
jgi:GPI mannosyltransferase 2